MRLWTIHPRYLDPKGLVAAWREALLAQKVLAGKTRGYRHHPQLVRFLTQPDPAAAIASYLSGIAEEARVRGYRFDVSKIASLDFSKRVPETRGQLLYEWQHLKRKLRKRAPHLLRVMNKISSPEPHPLFRIVRGRVRSWEKAE